MHLFCKKVINIFIFQQSNLIEQVYVRNLILLAYFYSISRSHKHLK